MNEYYYDPQKGVEYRTSDNSPKPLLGCISSETNERLAKLKGIASDRERIASLAAPWDASDKPEIITYSAKWQNKLEEEAEAMDIMREHYKLPQVWDIARQFGYKLEDLCKSIQKCNDCTAWGTTRAATCLALFQKWFGAEMDIEPYNPSGIYAFSSGKEPEPQKPFPDNGRTIYAIAEAACETGNFPVSRIGEYKGDSRFTLSMINNIDVAEKNQTGFVYLGDKKRTAEELADIIILSLRACRPVIIGNTVALKQGTALNQDGVYVSDVVGNWGGGHCTAACDIKKVGSKYYVWIYNSHGDVYPSKDGAPAGGTFITRADLVKYLSGSFADVMPTTYTERPAIKPEFNLERK